MELLCEVATDHSAGFAVYFLNIFFRYFGYGPCESADASGC